MREGKERGARRKKPLGLARGEGEGKRIKGQVEEAGEDGKKSKMSWKGKQLGTTVLSDNK